MNRWALGMSLERPAFAIAVLDELVGLGGILRFERLVVPFQFLANAIRDITEERGLAERSRILEPACRAAAELDSFNPLFVMTEGLLKEGLGFHESFEISFGQQGMTTVVGQNHALRSNEQYPAFPFLVLSIGEQ